MSAANRTTPSIPSTDSPALMLLRRLEQVRQRGPGRWTAKCPAHGDNGPSLAITEQPDGRVLIHDFAGCPVREVVEAVGLTLTDLFPRRMTGDHFRRMERRAFDAAQRLACVDGEATVVAIIAERIARTGSLTDDDRARLLLASQRIAGAMR